MIFVVFGIFLGLTSIPTLAADKIRLDDVTINNGTEVPDREAPFMVFLEDAGVQCDGTILNERWIITSADCARYYKRPEILRIVVGTNRLSSGGQNYAAVKVILHEDYDDSRDQNNNLALIKTIVPIKFSKKVQPIKLAEADTKAGDDLKVYGWGRDQFAFHIGDTLLMNNVTAMSNTKCQKIHDDSPYSHTKIFDTQICSRPSDGSLGVNCVINMGDNGGPVVYGDRLVGVIFFAHCCTCFNLPDIATRVYPYLDWINNHIAN